MGTPLKQNSLSGGLLPECRYTGSLSALIKGDVACVFARDPAARNTIEVLTTYPGVHAIIVYRIANRLWCRGWRYIPRLFSFLARVWSGIDIHPGATIGARFFIDHGTGVVIGETAEVGDNVTLYHGVTLGGVSWSKGKRHPTLGNHVVVGAGAKILGPIRIGHFVRVGANSVVIRPVADRNTVVGIPAKAVQSPDLGTQSEDDVNLNHHLIPDPVAEAVSCLLERIRQLEQQLEVTGKTADKTSQAEDCTHCDALDLCEPKPSQAPSGEQC